MRTYPLPFLILTAFFSFFAGSWRCTLRLHGELCWSLSINTGNVWREEGDAFCSLRFLSLFSSSFSSLSSPASFSCFLFCAMPLLVFFFFHFHSFIILFLVLFLGDVINFLLNFDRLHLFLPLHYHLSLLPVFPFISFVFCKLQFH